jgi:hypothetical protein
VQDKLPFAVSILTFWFRGASIVRVQELLSRDKQLIMVPNATYLFEEPGKLEKVAEHASRCFQ